MLSQGQGGDPQEVGKKLEDGLLPRGPARRGREPGPGPTCQRFAWPSGLHFTISPRGRLTVWAGRGGPVPRYTVTRALLPIQGNTGSSPVGLPSPCSGISEHRGASFSDLRVLSSVLPDAVGPVSPTHGHLSDPRHLSFSLPFLPLLGTLPCCRAILQGCFLPVFAAPAVSWGSAEKETDEEWIFGSWGQTTDV